MALTYERIWWVNGSGTPLNATNLNKMDVVLEKIVDELNDVLTTINSDDAESPGIQQHIKSIESRLDQLITKDMIDQVEEELRDSIEKEVKDTEIWVKEYVGVPHTPATDTTPEVHATGIFKDVESNKNQIVELTNNQTNLLSDVAGLKKDVLTLDSKISKTVTAETFNETVDTIYESIHQQNETLGTHTQLISTLNADVNSNKTSIDRLDEIVDNLLLNLGATITWKTF